MKIYSLAFVLALSLGHSSHANPGSCEQLLLSDTFKIGAGPIFAYEGLTSTGEKAIDQLAADFMHNEEAFNLQIEGQEAQFTVNTLTASMGQNHLILGGPGAAKTMAITVLFGNSLWSKQIHEWTTPFEIFGGQTEEGLKKGIDDINLERSVFQQPFAMLDEINNANPATLGSLMAFLNPGERSYDVGGERIRGLTRAVFSTGNANRVELLNLFKERKMQSGAAMLNRFGFKSYLHNWRTPSQQARLDDVYKTRERLKRLAVRGSPEQQASARKYLAKTEIKPLDYDLIEDIATFAFSTSDSLETLTREFIDALRLKMNDQSLKTKLEAELDPQKKPFEPSTEWTERTRSQFLRLIRHSAALDLLRLPDHVRHGLMKNTIELSPLSLWRVHAMSITNSDGIVFFNLPHLNVKFNVSKSSVGPKVLLHETDLTVLASEARDKREQQQIEELELEQRIFNQELQETLNRFIKINKDVAAILQIHQDPDVEFESTEFESLVFGYLWGSLAKSIQQN